MRSFESLIFGAGRRRVIGVVVAVGRATVTLALPSTFGGRDLAVITIKKGCVSTCMPLK